MAVKAHHVALVVKTEKRGLWRLKDRTQSLGVSDSFRIPHSRSLRVSIGLKSRKTTKQVYVDCSLHK